MKDRKEKVFYKKPLIKQSNKVLDLLDNSVKLDMNFNLVKNGADINEVFTLNPCGLDAFLVSKQSITSSNEKMSKIDTPICMEAF